MRNMGRLFQYNRFGANDQTVESNRKDAPSQDCVTNKEPQLQFAANCPAYAELYPDYACNSIEATVTPTASTATTTTTMTSRSIDLALRKYQQWSSKFLPATSHTMPVQVQMPVMAAEASNKQTVMTTMPVVATNADCVTHLSTSSSHKSNSCSYPTTNTSGYYSRLEVALDRAETEQHHCWNAGGDRESLVSISKRPKVYDCMKDFLRRKLFQQRHGQQEQHRQQPPAQEATYCKSDTEEDVTSDYDEIDMLDSSYNADEEDASDCSSQCTFPLETDTEDEEPRQQYVPIGQAKQQHHQQHQCSTPKKSFSSQKSMLSLNCWQNITQYTDSTTEPEQEDGERNRETVDGQNTADDSDAGISDCCQLISEKSSPGRQRNRHLKQKQKQKRHPPRQHRARYNRNSDDGGNDDKELLASSWYQPRITTKAALERLQLAAPGTFLLRRKSRTYELCLRAETKVKHFVVVALANSHYKLKGAKKQFTSLKALVTHHSVMAEQLPLTLALPRDYNSNKAPGVSGKCAQAAMLDFGERTLKSLRYADDFDRYESLQILGLLQDWQSETNEF